MSTWSHILVIFNNDLYSYIISWTIFHFTESCNFFFLHGYREISAVFLKYFCKQAAFQNPNQHLSLFMLRMDTGSHWIHGTELCSLKSLSMDLAAPFEKSQKNASDYTDTEEKKLTGQIFDISRNHLGLSTTALFRTYSSGPWWKWLLLLVSMFIRWSDGLRSFPHLKVMVKAIFLQKDSYPFRVSLKLQLQKKGAINSVA